MNSALQQSMSDPWRPSFHLASLEMSVSISGVGLTPLPKAGLNPLCKVGLTHPTPREKKAGKCVSEHVWLSPGLYSIIRI